MSSNEAPMLEADTGVAGMTCSACGHTGLVDSRISTVFRNGDGWAVIRDIPAVVCPGCREEFIDDN
ncbi:MAG TPA: YgiT-type zinc finger protein, partial [Arenicellales bacterium]|nr:YgiT-type zinc finger protein [Arenicellales bacterium]